MKFLATFTNDETAMTSFVFESANECGGYGVSLRDDDSGNFVPVTIHGIKTLEAAIAEAKKAAGVK